MVHRPLSNAQTSAPSRSRLRGPENAQGGKPAQQGEFADGVSETTAQTVTAPRVDTNEATDRQPASSVVSETLVSEAPTSDLATQQQVAPSRTQSVSQPGATAQIDLINWTAHNLAHDDDGPYVEAGSLHVPSSTPMQTNFGEGLSVWMKGDVVGENIKRPRRREEEGAARAFLAENLKPETLQRLNAMNVYAGDASVAFRDGVTEDEMIKLLDAGAGHHGFAFLIEAKETSTYRPTTTMLHRLLHRWGPHTELVAERFVALARSERVKNPEELKSWYMGAGTKDIAADGYATMLNDAVDLIEAGHEIALEEMPKGMAPGLGDIIDLTEKVAYQHKRVAGKGIGGNIKKAVKQLAGFNDVPGAPEGFFGVAQIDARNNAHFSDKDDGFFLELVASLQLTKTSNFDELQIVLDDRMLVFDNKQKLIRVARGDENADGAAVQSGGGA